MKKIGKYEFDSLEQAESKINALGVSTDEDGNTYPTHSHCIVKLGYIVLEQGEYNEEGEETKAPVLSDKYHLDVLWKGLDPDEDGTYDHPYGWKKYSVDIDSDGVHSFLGLNYQLYKF
jgi:hypothetical protein